MAIKKFYSSSEPSEEENGFKKFYSLKQEDPVSVFRAAKEPFSDLPPWEDVQKKQADAPSLRERLEGGVSLKETAKYFPEALKETFEGIGRGIRFSTIFTLGTNKMKEKTLREEPEAVIDFANQYERVVGPYVRTAYAPRISLAVAEKLVGKDLAITYDELSKKYPVSTAVSGLVGDITNLMTIHALTGGVGALVEGKIGASTKLAHPFLTRYAPKALEYGATWGIKGAADESLTQFEKGNFDPSKLATETGKEFLFGTLLAAPLVTKTVPRQVVSMGTMRAGWTALNEYLKDGTLDKNDLLNITMNGVLGAAFGFIGAKQRTYQIFHKAQYNLSHSKLSSKVGETNAKLIEQTSLANNLQRTYGLNTKEAMEAAKLLPKGGYIPTNKPPVMIQKLTENQVEKGLSKFVKIPEPQQIAIARDSVKYAESLVSKGEPVWSAFMKALRGIEVSSVVSDSVPEAKPEKEISDITKGIIQNKEFDEAKNKLMFQGIDELTKDEVMTLNEGKYMLIDGDGVTDATIEHEVERVIREGFVEHNLDEITKIPTTMRTSKKRTWDKIGETIVRHWGLTPEIRNELVKMEGMRDLRKEDLQNLFIKLFPIEKEQAKQLAYHQENPEDYPINEELRPYAERVTKLVETSKKLQESRPGLQKQFFPQSFINKAQKEIKQHKDIIQGLKTESAINRHQKSIEELEEYIDFISRLGYIPHMYLTSESIQQNILKLLPESKITSKFRSSLSKMKGRKIATLEEAKEQGLVPEEDIRILLASHFEYLLRKVQIYDIVESFKNNPTATLPEEDAPEDWDKVSLAQLNGYRVNPFLTQTIEDMSVKGDTNIIAKGYDTANWLGKAMFFYNPIILPFWDVLQGTAAGGIKIKQPILGATFGGLIGGVPGALIGTWISPYLSKTGIQAIKDVVGKSEIYRKCVKLQVYSTPREGKQSPPVEESMKFLTSQIEKDYPGWKKKVEKMLGEKVNWKTFTPLTLYKQAWRFTWGLDRILRTMTYRHAINQGMDEQTAAEYTKTFHADYNIFTRKTKKWANRAFLVPTYKANMLFKLPKYVGGNTGKLFLKTLKGEKVEPEQKESLKALLRILLIGGTALTVAGWKDYYLREGYRLIKRLKKPEVTEEGRVLQEQVITLPGPFAEWPKLVTRIGKQGAMGLFMYLAKLPQIAAGLGRNARWNGDPYYEEGAAPSTQMRDIIINILKDYIAPYGQYDMMTRDEQTSLGNMLGLFGMATYKRGGTEQRILYEIKNREKKLYDYLKKPKVSQEDKTKAIRDYESFIEDKIEELEHYKLQQMD
jgi:hypothetical protein